VIGYRGIPRRDGGDPIFGETEKQIVGSGVYFKSMTFFWHSGRNVKSAVITVGHELKHLDISIEGAQNEEGLAEKYGEEAWSLYQRKGGKY
jgi:hypothetical protein